MITAIGAVRKKYTEADLDMRIGELHNENQIQCILFYWVLQSCTINSQWGNVYASQFIQITNISLLQFYNIEKSQNIKIIDYACTFQ